MKISELLDEDKRPGPAYGPDTKKYAGEKLPSLDDASTDIMNRGAYAGEPQHQDLAMNRDELSNFDRGFDQGNLKRLIHQGMSLMTELEQIVVRKIFWDDMNHAEVAKDLGITKERVRRLESDALRRLKHPSMSDKLRPHVPTPGRWDWSR